MSPFEILYLVFGGHLIMAGLIMITVYSLTNPWWTTHIGRMMITYAAAEILMSVLLMAAVVGHFNPHWFRAAWFALQTVVGSTFWFQTYVIVRLHQEKLKERTGP